MATNLARLLSRKCSLWQMALGFAHFDFQNVCSCETRKPLRPFASTRMHAHNVPFLLLVKVLPVDFRGKDVGGDLRSRNCHAGT